MWILFEVGLIAARFVTKAKPDEGDDEYRSLSESAMENELDDIEAAEKSRKT
jgi:hypothetical protein